MMVGPSQSPAVIRVFVAAALLAGCARFPGQTSSPGSHMGPDGTIEPTTSVSPDSPISIGEARLFTDTVGWVVTNQNSYLTHDGGKTWAAFPDGFAIDTVSALDERNLLAAGIEPDGIHVSMTVDSGAHWTMSRLDSRGQPGALTSAFHGRVAALLVQQTTSANFSIGDVYVRDPDGAWTVHSAPAAGALTIDGEGSLWLVGGVQHEGVWISSDNAESWRQVKLPTASSDAFAVSSAVALDDGSVVVTITTNGPDSTAVFVQTSDGGMTWKRGAVVDGLGQTVAGTSLPNAIVDAEHWVVLGAQSDALIRTSEAGVALPAISPPRLPPGVISLSFPTLSHGWAVSANGTCAADKTDCSLQERVSVTSDGGQTWAPLPIPTGTTAAQ